jgi:hypothetical protein
VPKAYFILVGLHLPAAVRRAADGETAADASGGTLNAAPRIRREIRTGF